MKWWRSKGVEVQDISADTFGKYQFCTQYEGVWYADADFDRGPGIGKPKLGAIPSPQEEDRTPFGQNRKKPPKTSAQRQLEYEEEQERVHNILEAQAATLVDGVAFEQPAWLKLYHELHAEDVTGFQFKCKRHGDFLTLFVSRDANKSAEPSWWDGSLPSATFSTSINLSRCRTIQLKQGHEPDMGGVVRFRFGYIDEDGGRSWLGGSGWGHCLPAGKTIAVSKPKPDSRRWYKMFEISPEPNAEIQSGIVHHSGNDSYEIKTTISPGARRAEDDVILFEDIRSALFVPAGLGEAVQSAILKEIERGHRAKKRKSPPPIS